jgi:hypothetical protein
VFLVCFGGTASAASDNSLDTGEIDTITESGPTFYKDQNFGNAITACPQAGLRDPKAQPLNAVTDPVAQLSDRGSNIRVNQDYSCMPQDETSMDRNPAAQQNIVAGANDYRIGFGSSGFYSSTDNGKHWYDGITPFPSTPSNTTNLLGGGDPAIVFDREGIAYYAQINFSRVDSTSGVWVNRSTNGGFTWSRPCVAIQVAPPPNEQSRCGGPGDPRQPGDGTVAFNPGPGGPQYDKEWITAGPRPIDPTTGKPILPQCFTPLAHAPRTCAPDAVGVDRLYVTYSLFSNSGSAEIFLSYSDDRAHSWSPPRFIAGSATFCETPTGRCSDSQGSQPTVNPTTGQLWVGFINGDTQDEDQYLVVTSKDGGNTFSPPSRVDTLYDVNEPRGVNGRADCVARGQQSTRAVLTNSCFRMDPIMNSIVADKRGGAFANDVYVVLYDNRNGTIRNSNNDIFFYKSTDGGVTWIGPTRVNNDRSTAPTNRDCGRNTDSIRGNAANCPNVNYGADQWFPWVTIDTKGLLNVTFHDRRLDTSSPVGVGPWPTSKTEQGNYLVWFWGAQCRITQTQVVSQTTTGPVPAGASQCVAPEAVVNPTVATGFDPGAGPVPGQNQNPDTLPFRNFQISDVPSNWDYSFRAGIFAGDYTGNSSGPINPILDRNGNDGDQGDNSNSQPFAIWTDARNGRGSGDPTSFQPGRNPICEQSDIFFDTFSAYANDHGNGNGRGDNRGSGDLTPWLVTPCPTTMQDKESDHGNGNGGDGNNNH